MKLHHPLHLNVVAIEKGAFGSSSTKFANFTFTYKKSKVGDRSRGRPEGSLFNSYYTEV